MGKRKSMKQVIETLDDVWGVHVKIDGKLFTLYETYTNPSAARKKAKELRAKGRLLVRVRKVNNVFNRSYIPFKYLYRVYTRRK